MSDKEPQQSQALTEEQIPAVETGACPAGEAPTGASALDLQAELETERAARQAAEERTLRYRADFENLRRRMLAEAEGARCNLIQDLAGRLLPVLDDMERALATLEAEATASWAEGLNLVYRRFLAVLNELGVNRLETVGREFDPAWHEAMLRVEDSGQPANTIVEELRAGYVLGDRVVRPALVKVQV